MYTKFPNTLETKCQKHMEQQIRVQLQMVRDAKNKKGLKGSQPPITYRKDNTQIYTG